MPIRTKRIYDPSSPDDGFRLLTMRYWPRGIRKALVDAWDRGLAPSQELLHDIRTRTATWEQYTVTVVCSCKDESHCHRWLLAGLV